MSSLSTVFERLRPFWNSNAWRTDEDDPGIPEVIELTEVNQRNILDETPLMVAAFYLRKDDVQTLIECGADIHAKAQGERSSTALHLAYLGLKFENADVLIRHGADENVKNDDGLTPATLSLRPKSFG